MRFSDLVAFLAGAAFFAVLPLYAPPIVLQADEVPRFLLGLGATVAVGAALGLVAGLSRGVPLVLACAVVGASLYAVVEVSRIEQPWSLAVPLGTFAFVYESVFGVVGAALGARLAGPARTLAARLRRGRRGP